MYRCTISAESLHESIYFCGVQNFGSDDLVSLCILMLLVFLAEKVKIS
ncbi:hypothetical protein V6Z11_A05G272200 [Gossypium hirsutum]